jgi:hypothetical protein
MYLRLRSQVLERVRLDIHETGNAGAYTDARLIAHLQVATDAVWEKISAQVDGPGRVHEVRTIAASDPDGYVPGNALPLPARLLRLVPDTLRRNGGLLAPGREDRADFGLGGRYWIDGPTQATVGGLLTAVPGVLLTSTAWSQGDQLEWLYVERAPLWVDPTNGARDVAVDLVSTSIESAIAAITGARATAKNDRESLARARGVLAEELARLDDRIPDIDQPHRLADYRRRGYRYHQQ